MPTQSQAPTSLAWTWGIWVIFGALLFLQPNYRWSDDARTAPYGSDYLQEWVAGRVILAGDADRLYDWDHSRRLQHDPAVVGYEIDGDGYYPVVYPPYWYILCAPLSLLPLKWAAPAWLTLLTAVWFFGLRWCARSDGPLGRAMTRAPQLALVSAPLLLTYGMGQKSGLVALIVLVTAVLLEQRRFRTAGAVLALIAFKPHFALLLGIPLVLRFGLPFLTGCLATGLGWALLTYAVDGALFGEFLHVTLESLAGDYTSHGGYRLDDAHNWAGFWGRAIGLGATAHTLGRIWSVGTLFVVAIVVARKRQQPLTAAEWGVLTLGLVLASPHLYGYDLTLLLVPAWWMLRTLDARPPFAIGIGAVTWWGLSMLPHMARETAVPVQWSVVALASLFAFCVARAFGFGWSPSIAMGPKPGVASASIEST